MVASLGQELKRERELRGISLEEISSSTKISLRFLEALEDDRLDILPGKFFVKAIICAYAKSIGLEENSILNKYYEESLFKEQAQESKVKKEKAHPAVPKKIKKLIGLSLLIFLSLIILCLVYLSFQKKETSSPLAKPEVSAPIREEKPKAPSVEEILAEYIPEKKKLALEISFLEETWIQVYADGELEVDSLKQPGEKITIEALEELLIHLGNAGGISFTLNNQKGKPIGSSGVVVRNLRITLENYQKFLAQEEETIDNQRKESRKS